VRPWVRRHRPPERSRRQGRVGTESGAVIAADLEANTPWPTVDATTCKRFHHDTVRPQPTHAASNGGDWMARHRGQSTNADATIEDVASAAGGSGGNVKRGPRGLPTAPPSPGARLPEAASRLRYRPDP